MSSNARQKAEKATPILPAEVVTEILTWLPLKPLARAQLVSKEWRATIQNRHFMEKHTKRNSYVFHWFNINFSPETPKSERRHRYLHGCDGLLLSKDNLPPYSHVLWNPASRLVLDLPPPRNGSYGLSLFFVPATGKYKVVSFFKDRYFGTHGCQLLTPGVPSMEWRLLGFPELAKAVVWTTVVPAGGDVHCVVLTKAGEETVAEIVSLDVETEILTVNRLPVGVFADVGGAKEIDCDGKLGFAAVDKGKQEVQVMVLHDFKRKRRCNNKEVIPLPFLKEEGFKGKKLVPLLIKEGGIWFWMEDGRIFVYTVETGKISDVWKCKGLLLGTKLYSYKPSLVTFEGMRKEGEDEGKRLRPHNLLIPID